jgi:hypothetical protein
VRMSLRMAQRVMAVPSVIARDNSRMAALEELARRL